MPSRCTGTTGHAAAEREVGGAAAELLAPAVGAAPALGEDDQAPAVVEQLDAARSADRRLTLRALDRDGADGERGHARLDHALSKK